MSELVIEPADYKTWLPRGDLKDWNNPGNVLFVVAALQTKDGNVPVSRAIRFRFELLEVSKEKGVCMNRPNKAFANEDRDLRFPQELNLPPVVDYFLEVDNGGLTATTQDGEYYIVEAAIASYDFGAYGKLKVTAEVNGQAGYTYKVDVTDNGNPGRNDAFSLMVSNGYSASSGTLGGGNIQLHQPCQ